MNVAEALVQLSAISVSHNEDIRLLIDCPHCGRSGELGSLRPMVQAAPTSFRSDKTRERAGHDAELRRISTALGLPWPTTVEDIVMAIRARPQ
jgi:hypothetical protein